MAGARTKRIQRIMESSLGDFIRECNQGEEYREEFRRNWSGGFGYNGGDHEPTYIATPLGTHRDDDARGESNWSVIEPAMEKADSFGHVSEHAGVFVHREGSCLNGWNEHVMVRIDDAVALKTAMDFCAALADYPVLDEEDFSNREWEENHPDDGHSCYAESCDCAQGQHDRMNDDDAHSGCRAWLAGTLREQDTPGWRGMESHDVSEDHYEYDEVNPSDVTAEADPDRTYVNEPERGRFTVFSWWCGHDGCGHWIVATNEDRKLLRQNRLFSDLPVILTEAEQNADREAKGQAAFGE